MSDEKRVQIDDMLDALIEAAIYCEECGVVYRDQAKRQLEEARAAIKAVVVCEKGGL